MRFDDLDQDIEDERVKLFDEVWNEPMTTVAKRYGISDNGLRKRCIKLEIPLPPIGHWAKLEAGKTVMTKPELPPLHFSQQNDSIQTKIIRLINTSNLTTAELKELDELTLLTPESKDRFLSWCKNIKVPKRVDNYNQLLTDYQAEMKYRKERDEEHQFRDVMFLSLWQEMSRTKVKYRNNKAVLPISVSNKRATRALVLIDTLIHLVNELDGRVVVNSGEKDNASLRLLGQSFSFYLNEIMVKRRYLLSDPNSENIVLDFRPLYEKVPSGRFEIVFQEENHLEEGTSAKRFTDSEEAPVERQLGEIFTQLVRTAIRSKISEIISEREYKEEKKEQQRLLEIEENKKKKLQAIAERARRKQHLVENIESEMVNWNKSKQLLQFAQELEEYVSSISDATDKELLTTYINLVRQKANKCDPLADILKEVRGIIDTEL